MDMILHEREGALIAEVRSDSMAICTAQDALDAMAEAGARGARSLVFHQACLAPEFFDLRSRLAGEILQKFSTYRVSLAVVCGLEGASSESLKAFVRESNRGGQTMFVPSLEAALARLARLARNGG